MPSLQQRSYTKELLDADNIPFEAIKQNMQELNTINTLLGGHKITVAGLKQIIGNKNKITVCEVGCGGGDNLYALQKYCTSKKIEVHFTGIDIKSSCLTFASEKYPQLSADWMCTDYKLATFKEPPHVIFSSLFCHHFNEKDLTEMMVWMKQNSQLGYFINDLHRHPVAYYFIKIATALFSNSYLVKNDAPLSVQRGFLKKEWLAILNAAHINNFKILWKWAFRHLIIVKHGG